MSLLEEFNEELSKEEKLSDKNKNEELSEEDEELLGELDGVSLEDTILEEISQKEIKNKEKEQKNLDQLNDEINITEDEELSDSENFEYLAQEPKEDLKIEELDTLIQKTRKEKELAAELDELKQKNIEKFIKEKIQLKKTRYTTAQVEALKIQLSDIISSPTLFAYIRKGTRIVDLESNKYVTVPKGVTVKAYSLTDANNFRYIVNNKNELKYKAYFSKLSNIKDVTQMYQKPHYFSRVRKVKKVSLFDKKFDYSIKFNLHGGLTLTQYTNNIIGGTENYAPMVRSELGFMTNFNHPVKVGLSGMYESVTGGLMRGGKFSAKTLSFGPTIVKDKIFKNYDLIFQPRVSLFSDLVEQGNDSTKVHKLSDTSLLIGIESFTDYKMFGKLTIGYNFQRKWIKPKAQNTAFDIGNDLRYDDSFAIYVGHRSDWIW